MRVLVLLLSLTCLGCDWGKEEKQPFADSTAGPGIDVNCAEKKKALELPRPGVGDTDVRVNC